MQNNAIILNAYNPISRRFLTAQHLAGLLTYPSLKRLPILAYSGLECLSCYKDSQQRVLLVNYTLFPFHLFI